MSKPVVEFRYWWNITEDEGTDTWVPFYKIPGADLPQITCCDALSQGFALGPTPSLDEWKVIQETRKTERRICGLDGCPYRIRDDENARWHLRISHRMIGHQHASNGDCDCHSRVPRVAL